LGCGCGSTGTGNRAAGADRRSKETGGEVWDKRNMKSEETTKPVFYAHSKEGKAKIEWQEVIDHLTKTADYAESFGADSGISDLAYTAGLFHDLGKYSYEFQQRLEGKKIRVDHSTAGAKELLRICKGTPQEPLATLLAYCIIGHHTGLPDYGDSSDLPDNGTFLARLKSDVKNFDAYKMELDLAKLKFPNCLHIKPLKNYYGFSLSFLTRIIYSALVDADFQETEETIRGKMPRGGFNSVEELTTVFNAYIKKFDHPSRAIDQKRTEVLHTCTAAAKQNPGFFALTVPTGGGKTLASMAFALNHAKQHGLKRIIYVIPFTTIIEQNAAVFKDILGEQNVLEHHSNFDWEKKLKEKNKNPDDLTNNAYDKLKLAAENWDIPIVITTNVQFFESLFSNRSSHCRKIHNIAKSVIIFDEAQMLPLGYMKPCMNAVWELVTNYGASVVFCTATQPNLKQFLPANTELIELAPDPQKLFSFFHRVDINVLGKITDEALINRLRSHDQVLCIVNTRKHAKGLFDGLHCVGSFHLSTLMCPAHRKITLKRIRQRLADGKRCRLISTSVIEAGVDLDFSVGYRAVTGLDSINQAAGRVNREMKTTSGELFIFEPESKFTKRIPKYIAQAAEVTRYVLREHSLAPISIQAVKDYFVSLYSYKDEKDFDIKQILSCFTCDRSFIANFSSAADKFRIIDDITVPVIIPFNKDAKKLIEELKHTLFPTSILRKLQLYTVNIYEDEFKILLSKGVFDYVNDAYAVLNDPKYYQKKTGLVIPANCGGDALFY
jgi:CRISPR-associated endonuclease/helicase Cas3